MSSTNTDQVLAAVDLLTSDNARQAIASRIAELSAEITRLRGIESMLSGKPASKKRRNGTEVNEQRIHEHITANGPCTAEEIAKALGIHSISVGHAVAYSNRMHKQGKRVVLS